MSLMNIRDAIIAAADHIEESPELYDYWTSSVPEFGTPGCALGWIALFSGGAGPGKSVHDFCDQQICESGEFYERMARLSTGWTRNPELCAAGLRLYADHYHGLEQS